MSVQPARSVVHSESGMALLGTVFVAALVLGLAGWGILNMTGNAQKSLYGESTANQARTAALMGIQAVTGYAQSVYVGTNPPTSASLTNLDYANTPGLAPNSGPVDQSFTQPTNANVQAMVVNNTFSGTATTISSSASGYIKILSTGRSGSSIETAEAYLTAQMNTLHNNKYSVILGGTATLNGGVQNDTNSPTIYVGEGPGSKITINGNTNSTSVVYLPASSLPIINPNGLEQYSTIQLVNGVVTIPASAVDFYINEGFLPEGISTTAAYTCSEGTGSNCASTLPISYTSGTWSIGNIPAFVYSNQAVNVAVTGVDQLTVASTGSITTINDGVSLSPFGSLASSGTPTTIDYCQQSGGYSLPICNVGTNPETPYSLVQGLIYVTSGANNITGKSDTFYGDLASVGELNVSGTGGATFAGTTVAEGGYTGSNGILKVSNPVAAANSATLGGYQLTPTSIRWAP